MAIKYTLFILLYHIITLVIPAVLEAKITDRIVAIVNEKIVTLSELESKTYPIMEQYIRQGVPREEIEAEQDTIMAKILPQLIDEMLVEEEAQKLGIKVDNREVEETIDRICNANGMTREELDSKMKEEGLSLAKYSKELKRQIERTKIINAQVQSKIVITDEQVIKFIGGETKGATYGGPYYTLDHICVAPEDFNSEQSKEEALEEAERIFEKLKNGKDLAELLETYSKMSLNVQGGRLGVFSVDEMAPFVKKSVIKLDTGEFSEIIDTSSGYQIFRVVNVSNTKLTSISPEKMEEIREKLYKIEINEKFEEWLSKLRSSATIKILL